MKLWNVPGVSWYKLSEVMELKNEPLLRIFQGNSKRLTEGLHYCMSFKEVVDGNITHSYA